MKHSASYQKAWKIAQSCVGGFRRFPPKRRKYILNPFCKSSFKFNNVLKNLEGRYPVLKEDYGKGPNIVKFRKECRRREVTFSKPRKLLLPPPEKSCLLYVYCVEKTTTIAVINTSALTISYAHK